MSKPIDASRTAVVSDRPPPPDVSRFLEANGLSDAACIRADKIDELHKKVLRNDFDAVVFPSITTALDAVWEGDARFEDWARAGVHVHVATSPPTDPGSLLAVVQADYDRWHGLRRRRHAVAGAVLSALALGAAFVIHLG